MSQRVAGVPPVVATGEPEGWEIIMSAYLMISLNTKVFCSLNRSLSSPDADEVVAAFPRHQQWNHQPDWKHTLNNLRLIIQPLILLSSILPWLDIFPNHYLCYGWGFIT